MWIMVAMLLGILAGYYINSNWSGNHVRYSPAKDFVGIDSVKLSINGTDLFQPILVVKDSANYRRIKDSVQKDTWLVVSNTNKSYVPLSLTNGGNITKISKQPSRGSASITALDEIADLLKLLTTIFLRLVQMIIAPIVFATLVVGIAKLGDMKTVGRVGGKAMIWFITASLISLGLGLLLVNITKPGVGADITQTDASGIKDLLDKSQGFSIQKFVEHVVPRSVVEAMATNEILQLVVFSIFFGIALTAIGKKGENIINALDSLAHVVLKMVTYVMYLAPAGVFGAMAAAIAGDFFCPGRATTPPHTLGTSVQLSSCLGRTPQPAPITAPNTTTAAAQMKSGGHCMR